jgi:hypothetical protein
MKMIDRVELERITLGVQTIIRNAADLPEPELRAMIGYAANEIIVSARFKIYAEAKRRVVADRYPSDWWEAFKERWLPWLGVRYTECGVDGLILYPTMRPVMKGGVPVFEAWVKDGKQEEDDGDE